MALEIGDVAPNFKSKDQDGKDIELSSFIGKKIILYFYPKDNTPGCTAQACNLRDNYEVLQSKGYAVLGVSVDDEKSHTKFIQKFDLPFPLVADTDHAIVESYGVWVEKNMYGRKYMGIARTTFVIDSNGLIAEIITKVNTKEHASQILEEDK
jgi:thioredoxin-dependent peroxiredoxin